MKILFYGYGNPGRQDDGLARGFIEGLRAWYSQSSLAGQDVSINFDLNYQLNIEDADNIKDYDRVVFVDASKDEKVGSFIVEELKPVEKEEFTMHAVHPGFVLALCNKMFDKAPESYLVHMKGYEWHLKEGLTEKAQENLEKALEFFKTKLQEKDYNFISS
jgi:hydrogenase maturation protease